MIYKLKHLQSVLAVTLCVVMSLAFAGCSKDEDGDKDNGKLVGVWDMKSSKGWEKENGKIIDQWNETLKSGEIIFQFNNDGTFEIYDNGILEDEGKYSYSGTKLKLIFDVDDDPEVEVYTCTISGDTMQIIYSETEKEDGDVYEYYEEANFIRIAD